MNHPQDGYKATGFKHQFTCRFYVQELVQTRDARVNSHLPVGRLAEQLESLSREHVWLAIVMVMTGVAYGDAAYPDIGFAPLYIPIICGACWALGAREGYFVATIAALLAVLPLLDDSSTISAALLRAAVQITSFLFIAAIVTSFRRSFDREQFHANRDRMTGTLNKEVFHWRCARAIEDAGHSRQALLLMILDLDDFKAVNSRAGHLAGDDVLRAFAQGASAIMRREDLIGRIGGDEFAMLARVPSIVEGQGFAHDIHARLSAVLAELPYPVTCSIGALLIPPEAPRDASTLIHAADQTMYRAKRGGKNAIQIDRAGDTDAGRQLGRKHRAAVA